MRENKYDEAVFFEKYSAMPRSVQGLAAAGEWPVLRAMLPPFAGKRVLDLGCGFGWHCRYAAQNGAAAVLGVDLSSNMLARARAETAEPQVAYRLGAIEDVELPTAGFEVVLSSLALHYVADFSAVCRKVAAALAPGGDFVFSVEHPVFTAEGGQNWCYDEAGGKRHWPVDRYFEEGPRQAVFLGERVVKYHRTLATLLAAPAACGLRVTQVAEPQPTAEMLAQVPQMAEELRRPMMLVVAAQKEG